MSSSSLSSINWYHSTPFLAFTNLLPIFFFIFVPHVFILLSYGTNTQRMRRSNMSLSSDEFLNMSLYFLQPDNIKYNLFRCHLMFPNMYYCLSSYLTWVCTCICASRKHKILYFKMSSNVSKYYCFSVVYFFFSTFLSFHGLILSVTNSCFNPSIHLPLFYYFSLSLALFLLISPFLWLLYSHPIYSLPFSIPLSRPPTKITSLFCACFWCCTCLRQKLIFWASMRCPRW